MPYKSLEAKKEGYKKWLAGNRGYRILYLKEYRHLEKVKVMLHYSNPIGSTICNNCGEQDIDVLCIDHIEGGGAKHYKELRNQGKGSRFYRELIEKDFPDGFQVLCANCNIKKSQYN